MLRKTGPCCRAAEGIITTEDLLAIEPKIKEAVVGEAFGASIVTAPPPSSGTLSIPALRILEQVLRALSVPCCAAESDCGNLFDDLLHINLAIEK